MSNKRPSRGVYIPKNSECLVFLTVTTFNRRRWLSNRQAHRLLRNAWTHSTAWLVGTYLLMPDHLHLFCAPRNVSCEIETWIRYWKREFAQQSRDLTWKFQSSGWHHRLRHDESREEKWHYIVNNPVRAGLATSSADWPYQGKIFDI